MSDKNKTTQPNKNVGAKPVKAIVQEQDTGDLLFELWRRLKDQVHRILDIEEGMDQQKTITSIMSNKEMKGANVWLLFAAIMVASIGLDTNSQAVIIGAMLISPLMSPILGIGLSIGINNRNTLRISLRHFGIAIAVSLSTSFFYFLLTPFASGEPTEQIIARTAPTFLDVLIAFFGGLAGIVSGTRKEQSNAIPGVAIATALLPPLCVSGYGLAKGNFYIFINSFYLFFINSVFVALATYLIVRFLDFPFKEYVNIQEKRRSKFYIAIFVISVMIPSTFIFFNVVQDLRRQQGIKQFVDDHFKDAISDIDKIEGTDSLELQVFWFRKPISRTDSIHFIKSFPDYNIFDTKLTIIRTSSQQDSERAKKTSDQNKRLFESLKQEQRIKEKIIAQRDNIQARLDSLIADKTILSRVEKEYRVSYPELNSLSFGKIEQLKDTMIVEVPVMRFGWQKMEAKKKEDYEKRIMDSFKTRFDLDTIIMVE